VRQIARYLIFPSNKLAGPFTGLIRATCPPSNWPQYGEKFLKRIIFFRISPFLSASIQKVFAIDPMPGSTYLNAEHIVILMQENRSFDHTFGKLRGVRGFNDPRAMTLPNGKHIAVEPKCCGCPTRRSICQLGSRSH
jgi:phospholipase C